METHLLDSPQRDFMLTCKRENCLFFVDCYADQDFDWKTCPMSGHQKPTGGWSRGSEEERRLYDNLFRDEAFCQWRDGGFKGNFRNLQGLPEGDEM